jgi:uncharacterized protein
MRLLADAMLGRLAKWLRMMGYDTLYSSTADDNEIARVARAENRVVLTRDRQLVRRRGVRAVLIESENLDDQICQLARELDLDVKNDIMSRCIACNALLEDLPREEAEGLVPPYVFATQACFKRCPKCARVYWRGTHWTSMMAKLDFLAHSKGL